MVCAGIPAHIPLGLSIAMVILWHPAALPCMLMACKMPREQLVAALWRGCLLEGGVGGEGGWRGEGQFG